MNKLPVIFFASVMLSFLIPATNAGMMANQGAILCYDSANISVRLPDKEVFDKYYSDNDFNYQKSVNISEDFGFWFRFWRFIGNYLHKATLLLSAIPIIFVIIIVGVVFLFLFILISKTKMYRLFYCQEDISQIPFSDFDMEDRNADIDNQIELEIMNQNFRKAIRLMFIKLLRRLESRHFIVFAKGKTNYNYQSELRGTSLFEDFNKSVVTYEYVWYGNFQINKMNFEDLSGSFNNLYRQTE